MTEYLRVNDAGVATAVSAGLEPAGVGELISVLQLAELASSSKQCHAALRAAATLYRRGHLSVEPIDSMSGQPGMPQPGYPTVVVRALSEQVVLLSLPTFSGDAQRQIEHALQSGRSILRSRPIWILDVRGNGGGSDWAWKSLLHLFGATTQLTYGIEHLATPANIAANQLLRQKIGAQDPAADVFLAGAIAGMRGAPEGSYVSPGGIPTGKRFAVSSKREATRPPGFVAILTDGKCGSSCEQFVLEARQSWRVKVYGQNTAGVLDFSNLRPWTLPSKRYVLWYATSRSMRLPEHGIDGRGVSPDVPLPDELMGDSRAVDLIRKLVEQPQARFRRLSGRRP